ncbi:MAG: hypothetical protein U1E56_07805 [Bauldia sp.]
MPIRDHTIALVAGFGLIAVDPVMAQTPKPSLRQLLVEGYEIKNVLFAPIEALPALNASAANPQVIVTLQRGPSTAACQFSAVNWINQVATSLEGTTQCEVYR